MMKANIIKRMMAAALTVSLAVVPSMGVLASSSPASGATTEEKVIELVNENLAVAVTSAPEESDDGESTTVSSVAEIPKISSVAGVKSSVAGVYLATSVNGAAITTGLGTISNAYGLANGEKPYARLYNLEAKKSPLAYAVIENAAASLNATVGPTINIELGKMSGGKYSLLPSDGAAIEVKLGIPKSFAQEGKTFAMVCVRPGGAVVVLQDIDSNPNTITFNTTGGQGAYAIIKY